MVEVKQLLSFALPRNPAIVSPGLREILMSGSSLSGLPSLYDGKDMFRSAGNRMLWPKPLPAPLYGGATKGRIFSYVAGVIFVPNTVKGVVKNIKKDFWDDSIGKVIKAQMLGIDFQAMTAPPWAGEPPEDISDAVEAVFDAIESGTGKVDENLLYATYWSYRWFSMQRRGAVFLPLTDLVEVSVQQTKGGFLEHFKYEVGEHIGLTFETASGQRSTYYATMSYPDEDERLLRFVPPADRKKEYQSRKLSTEEATALIFADQRIRADIRAVMRTLLDEHLGPGVLPAAYAELSKTRTQDWSRGLDVYYEALRSTDYNVWHAHGDVLARMGSTCVAFRALPFARHGFTNPIDSIERGEPMTWVSIT